jgi:tol-pal system protein YbgF
MFRSSILFWLRLGALLLAVALPAVARAQDANTQARLDRLERDLNMLQRQVYRGAPTAMPSPGAPPGGGSMTAADVEIRMERLEAQMRDLTGKVEEIGNGLEQLKQRVEQINSDLDVRFSQMSGTASAAPPPRGAPDSGRLAAAPAPGSIVPPPSGGGGLNPIFGTLSPPGSGPSRPPPADTEPLPGGSVNEQFNHAFGLLKEADYAGAEEAFQAFIQAHPNDPMAGSAQYWLGESYLREEKYKDAASAFAEGYKRFPKGPKAAETLLALGVSLARSDQKKSACVVLSQLDHEFPNSSSAVKAHAAAEKKRIGCG